MRLLSLLIILLSGTTMAKTFKNEIKFHTITPRIKIRWNSPATLASTAGINSMGNDYAPIGHFAVEINCEQPNKYGINHVLTGMERADKAESRKIVLEKKIGLGSLFYNFPGDLQNADSTAEELRQAKEAGRLTTVTVPTSAERCQKAMDFIDQWIEQGSYTIYGGNKKVALGEGSGCADFALEFFTIATSVVVPDDLLVKVLVPNKLIGDSKNKKIKYSNILTTFKWGKSTKTSKLYVTPDSNRVREYLYLNATQIDDNYVYLRHLGGKERPKMLAMDAVSFFSDYIDSQAELLPEYKKSYDFEFSYPQREESSKTWERISVKELN